MAQAAASLEPCRPMTYHRRWHQGHCAKIQDEPSLPPPPTAKNLHHTLPKKNHQLLYRKICQVWGRKRNAHQTSPRRCGGPTSLSRYGSFRPVKMNHSFQLHIHLVRQSAHAPVQYNQPGQVGGRGDGHLPCWEFLFKTIVCMHGPLPKCVRDKGCRYQHHQDLCQDHVPDGHACFDQGSQCDWPGEEASKDGHMGMENIEAHNCRSAPKAGPPVRTCT